MRIITLAAHKGGVGKTTLAAHLAILAERSGDGPVAMIDLDPQGSLTAWWNERRQDDPLLAAATADNLAVVIPELERSGVQTLLIDTPPGFDATIRSAIAVSDFVLIPTGASPVDLRAVGTTLDAVETAKKNFAFVLNRVAPRTMLSQQATTVLAQNGKVAPVQLAARVEYAAAMTDGRVAVEIQPGGKGAGEVGTLYAYITAQLDRTHRRTAAAAAAP